MGGRGGASHIRGGSRIGRGQLPPWSDNATALMQIVRDTGYTLDQASLAQLTQIRYYGDDYDSFTMGLLPDETRIVSDALLRMPYYNGGLMFRGIEMNYSDMRRVFLDKWKPGTVQVFTDKLGNGNTTLSSFSSERRVAESFGNWNYVSGSNASMMFVVESNRTAPGVQHISKFGEREAEVLSPAGQRFYVRDVVQEPGPRLRFTVYLEDRGMGRRRR